MKLFNEYIERFSRIYIKENQIKLIDSYLLLAQIYNDKRLEYYLLITKMTYKEDYINANSLAKEALDKYDCYYIKHGVAVLYALQGKTKIAYDMFKEIVKERPNFKYSVNGIGIVARELKKYKESEKACLEAAELDSEFVHPWVNLGDLFLDMNEKEKAIKAYQKALEIDENMLEAKEKIEQIEK